MPDVSPIEAERALLAITNRVVRRHESVSHRLKQRIYNRIGDTPTSTDMTALLTFMKSELSALEVNEAANKSLEKNRGEPGSGTSGVDCQVNAAEANRGVGGARSSSQLLRVSGHCTQWLNFGQCSYGRRCKYAHAPEMRNYAHHDGGKGGIRLCPFGSKCKRHRDGKCELSHETPEDGERKQVRRRMSCFSLALEQETQRSRQRVCLRR